ncbi:MAG: NAD(P)/FAD-dependent oxidoreductase [Acidimicrobiales bacterium]
MPARDDPLPLDGAVVVVGGSLAGLRAAQELRTGGFRGRLVMVCEERHLPYDRPPLSKQVLAGKWEPEAATLVGPEDLERLSLEVLVGHRAISLESISRRVELDDGGWLGADGVVVATGARPRRIFQDQGVLVLRTIEDCSRIRSRVLSVGEGCRLVVIGAGFIGSEVAATCCGLGCSVTLLESLDAPFAQALGRELGGAVGALHTANGVTLETSCSVSAVHPRPDGTSRVQLGDGTMLTADLVVAGVGVVPADSWLKDSGLAVQDGVVCDEHLFAADGVVAAGDVARFSFNGELARIEHWQTAADLGVAAAQSLIAGRARAEVVRPLGYFWSDQYGKKIQVLGRLCPDDEVVVADGALDSNFVALLRRGHELRAAVSLGRPRQLMALRPLFLTGASFEEALRAMRN